MFVVTVVNKGVKFWLRRTTWAFHQERADVFATREEAQAAATSAEKFMAPSIKRSYKIEEVEG